MDTVMMRCSSCGAVEAVPRHLTGIPEEVATAEVGSCPSCLTIAGPAERWFDAWGTELNKVTLYPLSWLERIGGFNGLAHPYS